ncbi:MAG: hypothetical protein ACM3MG_03470 [Bacillota bacterium]
MKKLIAATLMLAGSSAFADSTVLKCTMSTKAAKPATINITLGDDTSVDFVTLTVTEKTGTAQFFSQLDKGTVAKQIGQGYLQMLAMNEKTSQSEDGVIKNAGFFGVSKDASGSFSGFMAANSNIYIITCSK